MHCTRFLPFILLLILLAGCAAPPPTATLTPSPAGRLTPFRSATPTLTRTPLELTTPTLEPTATPTPRTYVVKTGDLIGGIAFFFGITTEELLRANPTITPNALAAGTVLIIPAVAPTPTGFIPTPTPVGLTLGSPQCYRQATGGLTCFIPVSNSLETSVENISAELRVNDADGRLISSTLAFPLLNRLPPGKTLPLLVTLPPGAPAGATFSARLLTALPIPLEDERYVAVSVAYQRIELVSNALAAEISGELQMTAEGETARQVWLAAIAYDTDGNIVGVRRWESVTALESGRGQLFVLRVYSAGAPIERVELLVEGLR